MSDASIVILDDDGAAVLAAINAAFDTINTLHSGATAPAELVVGMLWADTGNSLLKRLASTGPAVWTTLGTLAANMGLLRIDGSNAMTGPIDEASAAPASAATLPITGANFLQPTGTTGITALGTAQAGAPRTIRFTTALTLTHNGASLIIPGAANITTASGDVAEFRSLGGGNWMLCNYTRGDGGLKLLGSLDLSHVLNEAQGTGITAAATTDIGAATGTYVQVNNASGATVISGLGTVQAGARRIVHFAITGGSVTLTYNATSLILPDATNMAMSNGDVAEFVSLGAGNWRMTNLQRTTTVARIWTYVTKTADYTIAAGTDYGKYFVFGASAAVTAALPSAAAATIGFIVGIRNANSNSAKVTVTPNGSDLIEGVATMDIGVGSSYVLISDGVSKWVRMDTGISPTTPQAFTTDSQVFGVGTATFTVPAGVYYIRVTLWSGAGAGGGTTSGGSYAGGAGGSGAFATGVFAVIPSQTYTVTVGAGGLGIANAAGGNGSTSSFGALLTCTGGDGGVAGANGSGGTGGAGGVASGSGTLINGNAGTSAGASNGWASAAGSTAPGVSGGGSVGTTPTSNAPQTGVLGSNGAAAGTSTTGTVRDSGGGSDGIHGATSGPGDAGGSPGASGSGSTGGATGPEKGGDGAAGKCIVEW